MSVVEINWSPTRRQLRQFGLLCLVALPILGWFWGATWTWIAILFVIACIVAGLSYLRPWLIRPLFIGLILITAPIGLVVGELAMLLIYFTIFLPISLLFRLVQRDALQLRIDRVRESYWQAKAEPKDVASYYRRY